MHYGIVWITVYKGKVKGCELVRLPIVGQWFIFSADKTQAEKRCLALRNLKLPADVDIAFTVAPLPMTGGTLGT